MEFRDYASDFGPFEGMTWLNCAHQGALPRIATEEAKEAVEWKVRPAELTQERFDGVPARLRRSLASLLDTSESQIVLGNSASFGMHLMANGIPWNSGDEILLVRGDFPSVILPWLGLEQRGVRVRQIEPEGTAVTAEELAAAITDDTRVFCTTWVHSFRGHVVDAEALGQVCRARGVTFVLNTSQGLGARPLAPDRLSVDAITNVGFKWLCGPYGTGFCWMRPELLDSLEYNQSYWLSMQTAADLERETEVSIRDDLGARRYDVFGTANFFNFKPWAAAIEYLVSKGIAEIAEHDQTLVQQVLDGLDRNQFTVYSPEAIDARSTLIVFRPKDAAATQRLYDALRNEEIYIALRRGNLRIAPHLFNTPSDIERVLDVLHRA